MVILGLNEDVRQPHQVLFCRFEFFFLHLVQVLVILQPLIRLDGAGRLNAVFVRDVEEVHESIEVALLDQLSALAPTVDLILQELIVLALA